MRYKKGTKKLIVIPDIDTIKDWLQRIFAFLHLNIRISSLLEDKPP